MNATLEATITKNSENAKPFELSGFVHYSSISSLNFCAEVLSTCLRADHKLSKEEIIQFPYTYQNLTDEEITLFKSRLDHYANRY